MKDQDSIFFKNFSYLLGFLVLLTIVLAVYASYKHDELVVNDDMAKDRSDIANTLATVARVNTGDAVIEVEEAPKLAFDGSTDGKLIYDAVCMACHTSGLAGAPKLEAADWTDRMTGGMDALVTSAINGKGAMPPRGGRADLSDEQMKATVEFMLQGF
jgi:cytochrome c5